MSTIRPAATDSAPTGRRQQGDSPPMGDVGGLSVVRQWSFGPC
ncbi:hypothetical protein [Streptomyces sp. BE230]|nr:hypothetical protein [Streptomyces sp. BE230]